MAQNAVHQVRKRLFEILRCALILRMSAGMAIAFMCVTAGAACVQATVGFGFAIVSVPLLSLLDPSFAPVPQLWVQLLLMSMIYWPERQHADWDGVRWTTIGRVPGGLVAGAFLFVVSPPVLQLTVGLMVLIAVFIIAWLPPMKPTRTSQFVAGAASSAGAVLAAVGGPPVALLYRDEEGPRLRATLSIIGLVGIVVALMIRGAIGELQTNWLLVGLSVPAVAAGFGLSLLVRRVVDGKRLRIAVLAISLLSAVVLIARGILAG